jgi:hypothetical protein
VQRGGGLSLVGLEEIGRLAHFSASHLPNI